MESRANLAIGLLNTLRLQDGAVFDAVRAPADLVSWLETGLSRAPGWAAPLREPPAARMLLTEALRLRGDISHLLEAHRAGEAPAPQALYGLNRVLAESRVSLWLRMEADDASLVELEVGERPLAYLAPIARAAAELMLGTDPARVRRCASGQCSLWFVDTSKGGRRKWRSMATCGNRAKAVRHRGRLESV